MIKKRLCSIILFLSMAVMLSSCDTDTIDTSDLTEAQDSVAMNIVSAVKDTDIQVEKETPVELEKNSSDAMQYPDAEQELTRSYVANRNTGKLHYADCYSVDRMKESNKVYMNCTRSEAVALYSPCERCNP